MIDQKNKKPWIVLITHGRFGEELKKSAEMILGTLKDVYCFSLLEGMAPEDLTTDLKKVLDTAPENTIIFTDLYGGTPSNIGTIFAIKNNYLVISGLNLPMLIEAEMMRSQDNYEKIDEKLISTGEEGIKNITQIMKERKCQVDERNKVS